MEYPEPTIDVKAQSAKLLEQASPRAGGVAAGVSCGYAGAGGGGGGASGHGAGAVGASGFASTAGGGAGGGGGGAGDTGAACGVGVGGGGAGHHYSPDFERKLSELLATAWDEGRWSPPGPVANPYGVGLPAPRADQQGFPGLRLLRLREAATAALAWIDNMAPTVRRTALAEQLRSALGKT